MTDTMYVGKSKLMCHYGLTWSEMVSEAIGAGVLLAFALIAWAVASVW